jgi:hypothetical protein
MAKRKKLQDQNPPRRVEIRGQDHLLAYITPEEAQLLMANGGTGEAGPMGIPSYPEPGMGGSSDTRSGSGNEGRGRDDDSGTDGGFSGDDPGQGTSSGTYGGSSSSSTGSGRTMSDAEIQAAIDAANAPLGPNVSEYGISTNTFGSNLFGGGYYPSGTEFGTPNYNAVTDAYTQMYEAQQFEPTTAASIMSIFNPFAALPRLQSFATQAMMPRFVNALAVAGNTPIYSGGRLVGVRNKYGNVVEGRDPNADEGGAGRDGYSDSRPQITSVNPATGQCDEGYMFDEDLQACRLDTRGGEETTPITPPPTFAPGAYARMGLLDQAPTGLLQAGGQPFDFAAANRAFRMGTATRPEYYSDPYDLTGYTLLG